ncbi:MAG: hypothetical protein ACM3U2_06280 [Deltaproteobacteria bacterium]
MTCLETPQSRCRLGVARCDITPPVGIYHRMWGAATHERATGVHRPLTATAVVFQAIAEGARSGGKSTPAGSTEHTRSSSRGATEQILIAVDHCLFLAREMNALLAAVARQAQVPLERLLVVFSHTHSAGFMDGDRRQLPGGEMIGPYLETLAEKTAQIVNEARASVRPATIVYGTGRCALAAHRDYRDETSGEFVCGFNPQGDADDTVLVACATDDAGRVLATFVNYGCHPTTLAWENQLISPDYPGAMREVVERAIPAPCVFLQGASGDLGPREGFSGDPALADRNGRQLGYTALSALEGLPPAMTRFEYAGPVVSGATLGVWKHQPLSADQIAATGNWHLDRWTVSLPYRPDRPTRESVLAALGQFEAARDRAEKTGDEALARDAHAMIERMNRQLTRLEALPAGPEIPLPVWLWRMGDACWLAVEAEHYQLLQRALRRRFLDRPIVVMTLANGSRPSYLPTADVYNTGAYPETIAVVARGSLERLIEAIGERIATWEFGKESS